MWVSRSTPPLTERNSKTCWAICANSLRPAPPKTFIKSSSISSINWRGKMKSEGRNTSSRRSPIAVSMASLINWSALERNQPLTWGALRTVSRICFGYHSYHHDRASEDHSKGPANVCTWARCSTIRSKATFSSSVYCGMGTGFATSRSPYWKKVRRAMPVVMICCPCNCCCISVVNAASITM